MIEAVKQFVEVEHRSLNPCETHSVKLVVGHQSFGLAIRCTEEEASWQAEQLAKALSHMIELIAPDLSIPCEEPFFDIKVERQKQMDKGYHLKHDDTHTSDELALAAAVYAIPVYMRAPDVTDHLWPFDDVPTPGGEDARYDQLKKAGALIVAEMSRINRSGKRV